MNPGSIVIANLANPSEKYWGVLESIAPWGVTLRGLNLSSFDDWVNDLLQQGEVSIGLTTVFFPLHRIERIFLDEPVGQAESLSQNFERRVGSSVEAFLGLADTPDTEFPN